MKTVTIRLPEELIKLARFKAALEGTTLSQKVRWLILKWVEAEEAAEDEILGKLLDGRLNEGNNDETQTIPHDTTEQS